MKIPDSAKMVFNGIFFDAFHWEQELFDGSSMTYEAVRRHDGVQVIATCGDKILISDEEQSGVGKFLSCIGGMGEPGESPLETAKREMLEETGMVTDDWSLYKKFDVGWAIQWSTHFFIARNVRKVQETSLEPGERISLKELSFEEFLDLGEEPQFRNREIANVLLRMKLHPMLAQDFKNLLFPQ